MNIGRDRQKELLRVIGRIEEKAGDEGIKAFAGCLRDLERNND